MTNLEFLERLVEVCRGYDDTYGSMPESNFEGAAVLKYAMTQLSPGLNLGALPDLTFYVRLSSFYAVALKLLRKERP